MKRRESLRQIDVRHLWHPYTNIDLFEKAEFPIIERAEGVYLYDVDGKAILDGISSWWACALGHSQPELVEAIQRQNAKLQHSILGGMSHKNAILLAEQLAEITPGDLNRSIFCSDGSSAVEAALKVTLQYWHNVGESQRTQFVSLEDAYHGDTLGSVGVGYVASFHAPFESVLRKGLRAASPHCFHCPMGKEPETCDVECFSSMEKVVRENHETIAGVIVEPLCQGAAGMRIYPAEYLMRLRRLCDDYSIILIADEIAVGFGRTGKMFACEHAQIAPDVMCLGKALTGGYLPMSACVTTDKIYDAFRNQDGNDRTFYHGHTYCGNPITSAVALAALDIYTEQNIIEKARPVMDALKEGIESLGELPCVSAHSSLGMMGVLEISEDAGGASYAKEIQKRAFDLGLHVRPLGNILYLWPPLVTSMDELNSMLAILREVLR